MSPKVGKLFTMDLSPPCRAVILTAAALGIDLELVEMNVFNGNNDRPEFLKINPNASIPTFMDNAGNVIGDSHAIMAYLVSTFGKDDSLYPKDLLQRSVVDQLLHFDSSAVYSLHMFIVRPMYNKLATGPDEAQIKAAERAYAALNRFLIGNKWVAGTNDPTIADLSLVTSILTILIEAPFDREKFANIDAWIKRCEALPYFHVNKKGHDFYAAMIAEMMQNKHDMLMKLRNLK